MMVIAMPGPGSSLLKMIDLATTALWPCRDAVRAIQPGIADLEMTKHSNGQAETTTCVEKEFE